MARPKKGEAREWHGHPCCAGPACGDSEGPPLQSSSCRGCPVHTAAGKDRTGQASRKTHPGGGDPSARTPPNTPSQPHGTPSLPGLPGAPSLLPSTGPQRSACDRIVLQCRGSPGDMGAQKAGRGISPLHTPHQEPPACSSQGRAVSSAPSPWSPLPGCRERRGGGGRSRKYGASGRGAGIGQVLSFFDHKERFQLQIIPHKEQQPDTSRGAIGTRFLKGTRLLCWHLKFL